MDNTTSLDMPELHRRLMASLGDGLLQRVEMRILEPSGLSMRIDGEKCLSSIGVWPNGCCDVDFLCIASEQGRFEHFEFTSIEDAYETVLSEIGRALGFVHQRRHGRQPATSGRSRAAASRL